MPLIYCPLCQRITYAYPHYGSNDEVTAYRCSVCYNVFNVDQVNVIPFPNERIILNDTFRNIIESIDKMKYDNLSDREIAEKFIYVLKFLARPDDINVKKWELAKWDYRGTREAYEYNRELEERIMQEFVKNVDNGDIIVEIMEPDEGDSIFIATDSISADIIKRVLRKYQLIRCTAF